MRRALDLALGVWSIASRRHLGLISAGVAFFAMLAVFPALGAIVALISLWMEPEGIVASLAPMAAFLPREAFVLLVDQSAALASARPVTLGLTGIISLLGMLWSARRGVAALMRGLRAIHGAKPREGVRDFAIAMGLTLLMMTAGATSVGMMVLLPLALSLMAPLFPGDSTLPALLWGVRWAIALTAIILALGVFYRFGPNTRAARRGRFFSPGLVVAVVLWVAVSVAFTLFVGSFGNYNEVYGSLGAAIALMVWFQLSAYVVLLGAAFNRVLDSRTAALSRAPGKTVPSGTG